jgi:MFS family permease
LDGQKTIKKYVKQDPALAGFFCGKNRYTHPMGEHRLHAAHRTIILSYILMGIRYAWFWVPIWVLYYLRFMDYAGLGLLETVMIVTSILFEVPAGMIVDRIGKRKGMILSSIITVIGTGVFVSVSTYWQFFPAVILWTIGFSFWSGTFEALQYDTLKSIGKEHDYQRVASRANTVRVASLGVSALIGGYLYTIDPRLPFGLFCLLNIATIPLSFLLTEPTIDTEKYEFTSIGSQFRRAVSILFRNATIGWVAFFIFIGWFIAIDEQALWDILAVSYGFTSTNLGMFYAVNYIVTGFVIFNITKFKFGLSDRWFFPLFGFLIGVSLLISPYLTGLVIPAANLIFRSSLIILIVTRILADINVITPSKNRTTVLSLYTMLKNLPYALFAFQIGRVTDQLGAQHVGNFLGIVASIGVVLLGLMTMKNVSAFCEREQRL